MTLGYLCGKPRKIVGEVVCCTVSRATGAVFLGTYVPEAADGLNFDRAICLCRDQNVKNIELSKIMGMELLKTKNRW